MVLSCRGADVDGEAVDDGLVTWNSRPPRLSGVLLVMKSAESVSYSCGVFLSVFVRLEDDVRLADLHEHLCPAKTQVSCQVVPANT